MGNCLVLEEKAIKIVKTDGKILKYKSPLRACQVLSEFAAGHVISQTFPATAVLEPDSRLRHGRLYYIFPLDPSTTPKLAKTKDKKKVRFADDDHKAGEEGGEIIKSGGSSSSSVVRIKVVISKRELAEMIARGGLSVENEMISSQLFQSEEKRISLGGDEDDDLSRSWKPALESIREIN